MTFLVFPNIFFIAPIAPKHGALNKLKQTYAYADSGVKNENGLPVANILLEIFLFSNPAIIDMDDITCSFAINPCIDETAISQLFFPTIGTNTQDIFRPISAKILS